MEQTSARLRKTFHYPTDNDSEDSLPEALDEEEQETLIRNLKQQNADVNILYARILIVITLLSIIPYLTVLSKPSTSLLSILSISSLLSTTYLLYTLPPTRTGLFMLDAWNTPKPTGVNVAARAQYVPREFQGGGPIAEYLPLLNVGLCLMLGLLGMVFKGREEVWWGFGWLPAVVYAVVLLAKYVMGSVDPQAELEGLRYGFKGA